MRRTVIGFTSVPTCPRRAPSPLSARGTPTHSLSHTTTHVHTDHDHCPDTPRSLSRLCRCLVHVLSRCWAARSREKRTV
eukprot:1859819-Rhodomonas_salina.1